jgi:hypothetical protein
MVEERYSLLGSQERGREREREREKRTRYTLSKLLPPTRFFLLVFTTSQQCQ